MIDAKTNARADIIETSVTQPSPPPTNVLVDAIGNVLRKAYQANGFDVGELTKLDDVGALPAREGCSVAYHFLVVLNSLTPKDEATVYKGLLSLSK